MGEKNNKATHKYIVITVCVLAIAIIIIAINIRFPGQISINQDVTEFSVTRGKDGAVQKVYDDKKIISKLDGMKVKTYSVVSRLKGDTLSGGWVYRISYKQPDGEKKSIVISQGKIEYNGKKYTTNDAALNDVITELDSIYEKQDSAALTFDLDDIKNITIKNSSTSKEVSIEGEVLNKCISRLLNDKMNEKTKPDIERILYEVTFNYGDGKSEKAIVYYGDTLSYNGKYYEECRNLGDVINEYVGDEQGKTY